MEKIQMTEEQVRKDLKKIIPFEFIKTIDEELFFEQLITNMKNSGYIIKPEIEHKIEEVEDYLRMWQQDNYNKDKEREFFKDIITSQLELIQLLKPYYFNSKEK